MNKPPATVWLAPCPCGRPLTELTITDIGQGTKWAGVSGNCCGEWTIEFRAKYLDFGGDECMKLAIEAWNDAPRSDKSLGPEEIKNLIERLDRYRVYINTFKCAATDMLEQEITTLKGKVDD